MAYTAVQGAFRVDQIVVLVLVVMVAMMVVAVLVVGRQTHFSVRPSSRNTGPS